MSTTLTLQITIICAAVVALACGRYAEQHRDPVTGTLAVFSAVLGALLLVVLLFRGPR